MGSNVAHGWTDERFEAAKQLWSDGRSAAEIAKRLGGVSRNAVIGKMNRAGLQRSSASDPRRAPHVRSQAKAFGATRVKPAKPRMKIIGGAVMEEAEARAARVIPFTAAFDPLPGTAPRPFVERAFGECAWPVGGEGADTLSCCAPTEHTYCATHRALGTQPMKSHQTPKAMERAARRWAA